MPWNVVLPMNAPWNTVTAWKSGAFVFARLETDVERKCEAMKPSKPGRAPSEMQPLESLGQLALVFESDSDDSNALLWERCDLPCGVSMATCLRLTVPNYCKLGRREDKPLAVWWFCNERSEPVTCRTGHHGKRKQWGFLTRSSSVLVSPPKKPQTQNKYTLFKVQRLQDPMT